MKSTLLFSCALAVIVMALALVQADELQDEVDSSLKKFCGGLAVTAPTKAQTFSNPKKIAVTVTRTPNAEAKVINGVDAYSIKSNGDPHYLQTVWKGSYTLNTKATLSVDLTKYKNLTLPGQFEFRVWVHNTKGPDCTLMSKVFKATSSAHSNAADESAFQNLNGDIDRGCFGVEIKTPTIGQHVSAGSPVSVQIQRDSAAHTDSIQSLELYKINLDSRESTKVQESWSGNQSISHLLNIKDTIPSSAAEDKTALYYKLTASTQHDETCEFYSHPFYVDA
ncbi:hypothetical protein K501DRAFT_258415 [Backusella circina FSU 941]|nr:hypothetical protein K501DRAFT_258415 [Backusella circina FSU 941]